METPNSTVNPSSIVDILTLRYDTSIQPNLPKKSWEDFVPIDHLVFPPLRIQFVVKLKVI